jgi:Xaa-Pro aminopeptidase
METPRRQVRLAAPKLPDFGSSEAEPAIPAATYAARLDALRARAKAAGFDVLLIYGDREHAANLAFLTGFDPRFEEAMLVLAEGREPMLMVGNEGWGYVDVSPIKPRRVLYQSFGLMGQPRDRSDRLATILAACGLREGAQVGIAGWKYFDATESDDAAHWFEAPSYIVDTARVLAGDPKRVRNAGALLMNPVDGLRVINDVDQLAVFEHAACQTSTAVKNVVFGLKPGMSEREAVRLMGLAGMPFSCHLMLSSGPRARLGLCSPSSRRIERGDPFTTAFGVWGALNCRAGFIAESEADLPAEIRDYVPKLVAPYFEAIVAWYETIGIGVTGGALYDAAMQRLADPFFGIFLNPGHLLGSIDEWLHSPIAKGSTVPLRSGMAFQVDVIPATGSAYFTSNIEDGIALADADLRAALAARHPEAWARIQARRDFMRDALGIRLKPEVLPFSNIPAYLPPYLLSPGRAMSAAA